MTHWDVNNIDDYCLDFLVESQIFYDKFIAFYFAERCKLDNIEIPYDIWCLYGRQYSYEPDSLLTVAHVAAKHRNLPEDFKYWEIDNEAGWSVAHESAAAGYLPKDFDNWWLSDRDVTSVAHVAVRYKHLAELFVERCNRWDIKNKYEWSVAHVAARHDTLPENFDRWEISNYQGWTVAHELVSLREPPPNFSAWDLADKDGTTVAHIAAYAGTCNKISIKNAQN